MTDHEKLAASLRRDFPAVKASLDKAWKRKPALRVIDCVLSLNRHYDRIVVPRLDRFESQNPSVTSVLNLSELIVTFASPEAFVRKALGYRDSGRAAILDSVVNKALEAAAVADGATELARLEAWAAAASPNDYRDWCIPGFALAGFQYLRMLFGANTTKPDVHMRRYVAASIGHAVADLEALILLEGAADATGACLRDLDAAIWERSARPSGRERRMGTRETNGDRCMSNHEMIASAVKDYRGEILTTSEIKKRILCKFPRFSEGSLLPNDHARGNKSACSCAGTGRRIFDRVERGRYQVR